MKTNPKIIIATLLTLIITPIIAVYLYGYSQTVEEMAVYQVVYVLR